MNTMTNSLNKECGIEKTPIKKLVRTSPISNVEILVKLEFYNLSGSVKDRPARYLINMAEQSGQLTTGGTIIESSSGNFGISLAMIGAQRGYRVIILIDPKTTMTNKRIIEAYGAETIIVTEKDDCGSYHKTRIALANQLAKEIPGSFRPDQCFNPSNAVAHYNITGPEIVNQLQEAPDIIVAAVSTGGQIGGLSRYFKKNNLACRIIAVDAVGSAVFGGESHSYLLPGMGLGWTSPNISDLSAIDRVYKVPDALAFQCCHIMARYEGFMLGGSSGAAIAAAFREAKEAKPGSKILVIAGDNGGRYVDTIFNQDWLENNGVMRSYKLENFHQDLTELNPYSCHPSECENYNLDLAQELGSNYL